MGEYLLTNWRMPEIRAIRDGFGEGLAEVGADNKVVVLTANLGKSTRTEEFARMYGERFFDVGVAEQNLIGVAAGMAMEGLVAFATSFGVFSPGRSWDQVRVSVAYSNANVKVVGSHGGLSVGENGATHQALEDVAIMRVLPNMKVIAPADANQAREAVKAMVKDYGPAYIRFPRAESASFTKPGVFEIGKAYIYREGKDVSVFAYGMQVWDVLMAAEELEREGIGVEVINVATIKPLDEETILESVRKTRKVITVEDHQVSGGLGGAIAELLGEKMPVPIVRVGVEDSFGESGKWPELYKKYGLDRASIKERIKEFVVHSKL